MSIMYYFAAMPVLLIVSIIYLVRVKEPRIYSAFSTCPHCGARLQEAFGPDRRRALACPSCACRSDEFGNSL